MKKIKELLLITPEMVLNKIYNEVFKGNIKDFLFLMMAEVLIYLPMMTHWLTNGDGTAISFTVKQGHQWEISLGRFGIMFTDKLRDNIVYPSGITTISLTLLAITIVLVFRIFDIDKNLIKFLTGALLVLSPVVSNTLTYYYCSDSYFLAYLLSVLTVYLFVKYFSILTWCGAVFCILVSLSLYQAYIGTTMTLCLIFLVHQILNSNKDSKKYLLRMVTGGAAGVVSYLLLFKILQKVMDFKATSNRGFDKMGVMKISEIPGRFLNAYRDVYHYFFTNQIVNNSWWHRDKVNLCIVLIIMVCTIYLLYKRNLFHLYEILMIVFAIILLPVSMGCMAILAPECPITDATGMLMIMQMNYLYVFLLLLCQEIGTVDIRQNILRWAGVGTVAYMVFLFFVYTNIFEHCLMLNLNKGYSVGSRMVTMIEEQENINGNTRIMVGGCMERGNYPSAWNEMYDITKGSIANYTMFWDSGMQSECWAGFMKAYLGSDFRYVDSKEQTQLQQTEEYKEMTDFPDEGSIKEIEGVLVIKLSD